MNVLAIYQKGIITMKAVIYARVSGNDSKYATSGIESQLDDCRRYCAGKGYEVIAEFYEEPNRSTSGADWLPEIEKVLNLAQEGAYSVLVVRELDRLSRDQYKQLGIETDLKYKGVRIEYVVGGHPPGAEGEITRSVARGIAAYERIKTAERTTRGRCRSVDAGNVIVGACTPFGYDVIKVNGSRQFVENETEAAVVRLMFNLYAKGFSLQDIVDYFAEHKIPKPGASSKRRAHGQLITNKNWHSGTIANMLKNETYAGRWYYRKTKPVKVASGKVRNIPRPRDEWIMVNVPAIIDDALFEAVQNRKRANKKVIGKQHKNFYVLGGFGKCGHCGNGISGITKVVDGKKYPKYVCNARHTPKRFGFRCDLPYFREDEVEPIVWAWVCSFLLNPEALAQAFDDYRQVANSPNNSLMSMIDANKRQVRDLESEKARLVKAYTKGILSLDDISREKVEIESELRDLNHANVKLERELTSQTLTDDDIASIQDMAAVIGEAIDVAIDDRDTQREVLSLLDFQAVFLEEDSEKFIDVSCILGRERLSATQATCGRARLASHYCL